MKKKKGFALMEPEKQKKIASMGGKKARDNGTAYRWDSEKAKEAGRKGGLKRWGKKEE